MTIKTAGEGSNVVLLHGLFGNSANLGGLARGLRADYAVHSVDLPGHGSSAPLPSMALPDIAASVWACLKEQGIEKPHLVGHSLGGKVAVQMAMLEPRTPASVCVLDIAPVEYPLNSHDVVFAAIESVDLSSLESREQADEMMAKHIAELGVRQFLLTNLRRADDRYVWRIDFGLLHKVYPELAAAPTLPALGKVCDAPCTVIYGQQSNYVLPEYEAAFRQRFSNCRFDGVAGTGHWLHAEKPKEVLALIKASIEQIS